MDKLKQMTAFVEAVDQGSLARAALAQQVTPVMLGRRIDALDGAWVSSCCTGPRAISH